MGTPQLSILIDTLSSTSDTQPSSPPVALVQRHDMRISLIGTQSEADLAQPHGLILILIGAQLCAASILIDTLSGNAPVSACDSCVRHAASNPIDTQPQTQSPVALAQPQPHPNPNLCAVLDPNIGAQPPALNPNRCATFCTRHAVRILIHRSEVHGPRTGRPHILILIGA
eukprot:4379263-Prymnesium_polylepis.1